MNNTSIQMELYSEVRTPTQALNFAPARKRGQKESTRNPQIEINKLESGQPNMSTKQSSHTSTPSNKKPTAKKLTRANSMLTMWRSIYTSTKQKLSSQKSTVQHLEENGALWEVMLNEMA